jgi:branched-chain amino acid transport system permease protein
MKTKRSVIYAIIAVVLLLSPTFLNAYWVDVLNNIGLYTILALSLNIILGHAGLFHMGHAAFYALGAYTTAIINTTYQIPILWLLPLSGVVAGLAALVVARPIIHLRGDYLLIVTIGLVEIVRIALVNNVFGITGGSNGIFGIDRPSLFGMTINKPWEFFYLIWGFAAVTIFLFDRLEKSRFGRALNYAREDDVAAEGSGVNTSHYKLIAFVIGAFWAGMVGNIFAAKMTIIAPESFNFWESVVLFMIVLLGGRGSIPGVILGAFLVLGLPEIFRQFATFRMLIFGAFMVAMMIFRTEGILPPLPRRYPIAKILGREGSA